MSENRSRDFWKEVKRIRGSSSNISSTVDGRSSAADIADMFASRYSDLYTSVSYDVEDMQTIRDELNRPMSVITDGYERITFVNTSDVINAFSKLKPGKRDGSLGLTTNHFTNACFESGTHVALLFSAMLIHGVITDDMNSCTLIPIPKGKNVNITDSSNYSGIALSSVFGKLFDLIFLGKYSDSLCTSELQYGFKAGHSTSMCTMVLKEALAYYTIDGDCILYISGCNEGL